MGEDSQSYRVTGTDASVPHLRDHHIADWE